MNLLTLLATTVLLFPANALLLAAAGLLLRQRLRWAIWLSWLALALLWLFSTRSGAMLLIAPLEIQNPPLVSIPAQAEAIVILGEGRRTNAPEYNALDVPSYLTLARLQYAARLHRQSGLPILVSGGSPNGEQESEAQLMARSLRDDFGVTAHWLETQSATTAENALRSAILLRQANLHQIILVTDAMHMPRALASFRNTGLTTFPAATVFFSKETASAYDFLPSGEGMRRSNYALHEWIGLLWYRFRGVI